LKVLIHTLLQQGVTRLVLVLRTVLTVLR